MPLSTKMNQTILDTVLDRLARLFLTGAGGDLAVARAAATQMLAAYNVETDQELGLAAETISFGLHALQALGQAADPGLSLNKTLRLRGSAVSLSREAHKAHRALNQLQRTRRAGASQSSAETEHETQPEARPETQLKSTPDIPTVNKSLHPIEVEAARTAAKDWLVGFHQREAQNRMNQGLPKPPLPQHPASAYPPNDAACIAVGPAPLR